MMPRAPFGRLVRYVTLHAEVVTGIVTATDPSDTSRVSLQLFTDGVNQAHLPTHVYEVDFAPVDPTGRAQTNTWHWPPRD